MNLPEELVGFFVDRRYREQVHSAMESLGVPYSITEYSERYKILIEVDEVDGDKVKHAIQQIEGGM